MNTAHDNLCASPEWAARLAEVIIPWGLAGLDLTGHVLELGGGFGASTAHLAGRLAAHTDRLTVLEADATLAEGLRRRFAGIDVRHADARAVPLPDGSIDAVVCFTMLHHVTPPAAQDKILAEARRVLRPGGWFAGTDSLANEDLRAFHAGDVYQPIDPDGLTARLHAAGFAEARTDLDDQHRRFRFRAVTDRPLDAGPRA